MPTIFEESGWQADEVLKRIDCTLPPAAPGCEPVATVGGMSYVVLRQSHHPQLALEILKLAAAFGLTSGHNAPAPFIQNALMPNASPPLFKSPQLLNAARARPLIPEYFRVSEQLQAMFESVIRTAVPPEQAVRRAAEFIGAITGLPLR
jgi:hypothetical protein